MTSIEKGRLQDISIPTEFSLLGTVHARRHFVAIVVDERFGKKKEGLLMQLTDKYPPTTRPIEVGEPDRLVGPSVNKFWSGK
jgi:hypothetical protein